MEKVYFCHNGKIICHKVLMETSDKFYIDRIAESGAIPALDKDFIGVNAFSTFEEAKSARLEAIKKHKEALDIEFAEIEEQKKAVSGKKIEDATEKK